MAEERIRNSVWEDDIKLKNDLDKYKLFNKVNFSGKNKTCMVISQLFPMALMGHHRPISRLC